MQRMRSLRCLPSYRARHRSTSFLGTDSRDSTKGALYQRKTIRKLDTAESCAKKIKMMLATLIPLPGRFASMLCIWPSLPSPYALIILAHLGCRRVLNLKTSSKQKKKKNFTHNGKNIQQPTFRCYDQRTCRSRGLLPRSDTRVAP